MTRNNTRSFKEEKKNQLFYCELLLLGFTGHWKQKLSLWFYNKES